MCEGIWVCVCGGDECGGHWGWVCGGVGVGDCVLDKWYSLYDSVYYYKQGYSIFNMIWKRWTDLCI